LVTSIPKVSGSLRSVQGRKDTLSKISRCTIFILIIFRLFEMSSGFYLSKIALFGIKWRPNALALYAIATNLLAQWWG
jgi:hypothetical protein